MWKGWVTTSQISVNIADVQIKYIPNTKSIMLKCNKEGDYWIRMYRKLLAGMKERAIRIWAKTAAAEKTVYFLNFCTS